jgi:23S rRNA (uridine2552-2'-O)-methyltransferase
VAYNPQDKYFKLAKEEGYAARSVYKLKEIEQKFKIFRSGQFILDLGAAPGSWSQYASERVGDRGRVLGVDLNPVSVTLSNATFITADLHDLELEKIFQEHGFQPQFDIVLSDMAPKTIGIKSVDQARSTELCELAIDVSRKFLKPGGTFICKFFHSGDFGALKGVLKKEYGRVEQMKPDSTRSISKEIFFVALKKK